ncbi:MAG TPA: GTPase ObgE [Rickettsiales bacterium]|nr:GTPase ObgE [Rickettsiales bacterium]
MQFIDEAVITVKAGNGGNGAISFRRAKYVPKGGPDGGDGGKGGDIIIKCVDNINTLLDFRYTQHFAAQNGEGGHGANKHGKDGKDLIINVPKGTQIYFNEDTEDCIDFTEVGLGILIAKGGNGGFGNTYFKSSVNQAPRRANPGQAGEEFNLHLKLKLLSDVGLIGLPNAGKSTFLSVSTKAKPKIANYPFTTLEPQLGVAKIDDYDFVIADLPGLIEGASEGKGLGDRFLKHTERCGVLLHLVDINSDDVVRDYKIIRKELKKYSSILAKKNEVVGLSKCDILSEEEINKRKALLEKEVKKGTKVFVISSATRTGITEILREVKKEVKKFKNVN